MFTGLIESVATIADVVASGDGARLKLHVRWPDGDATTLGDSVAVNGCCLTVVAADYKDGETLEFELSHETLARTCFGALLAGERCNVERALRLGDRLGGHMVTGHVDGTATLIERTDRAGAWDLVYELPEELELDVVEKGSITLDGVSLTVNATPAGRAAVTIIPHTAAHTQLLDGPIGKRVHVETDVIAKHVRRLVQVYDRRPEESLGLDEGLLRRAGFLLPSRR